MTSNVFFFDESNFDLNYNCFILYSKKLELKHE